MMMTIMPLMMMMTTTMMLMKIIVIYSALLYRLVSIPQSTSAVFAITSIGPCRSHIGPMVKNPALYTCTRCGALVFPTYTVLDCRTEQRARWQKIRWKDKCQQEAAREATIQRWVEITRMRRDDKDACNQLWKRWQRKQPAALSEQHFFFCTRVVRKCVLYMLLCLMCL